MFKKNDLVFLPRYYGPKTVGLVIGIGGDLEGLFVRVPSTMGIYTNEYLINKYNIDPKHLAKKFLVLGPDDLKKACKRKYKFED